MIAQTGSLAIAFPFGCDVLIPVDSDQGGSTGGPAAGWPSTSSSSSDEPGDDGPADDGADDGPDSGTDQGGASESSASGSTGDQTADGDSSSTGSTTPSLPADFGCELAAPEPKSSCEESLRSGGAVSGTIACEMEGAVADVYAFEASRGDCIVISADNVALAAGPTGMPAGDIFVYLHPAAGPAVVMDDGEACSDPVWNGFGCVRAGDVAPATGSYYIGIGQHGGDGCPGPSPYTLAVSVAGVGASLTPVASEVHCE